MSFTRINWTKTLKTDRRGHLVCSEIGSICARSSAKRAGNRVILNQFPEIHWKVSEENLQAISGSAELRRELPSDLSAETKDHSLLHIGLLPWASWHSHGETIVTGPGVVALYGQKQRRS